MSNVKKILVPLDGSKNSFRGLDRAIFLARQCQATITGLYVVPLTKPAKSKTMSSIERYFLKYATKFMLKAKTRAAKNGVLFYDKITCGDEGLKIVSYAKNNNCDVIVIGSRGQSEVKELFMGSTSNYVLHKSPIPVMIVK